MHRVQTLDRGESTLICNVKKILYFTCTQEFYPTTFSPNQAHRGDTLGNEMSSSCDTFLCAPTVWDEQDNVPPSLCLALGGVSMRSSLHTPTPPPLPTYPGHHGSNDMHSHSWMGPRQSSKMQQTSRPLNQTSLCVWTCVMCDVWTYVMCGHVWCGVYTYVWCVLPMPDVNRWPLLLLIRPMTLSAPSLVTYTLDNRWAKAWTSLASEDTKPSTPLLPFGTFPIIRTQRLCKEVQTGI